MFLHSRRTDLICRPKVIIDSLASSCDDEANFWQIEVMSTMLQLVAKLQSLVSTENKIFIVKYWHKIFACLVGNTKSIFPNPFDAFGTFVLNKH